MVEKGARFVGRSVCSGASSIKSMSPYRKPDFVCGIIFTWAKCIKRSSDYKSALLAQ